MPTTEELIRVLKLAQDALNDAVGDLQAAEDIPYDDEHDAPNPRWDRYTKVFAEIDALVGPLYARKF